MIKTLMMVLLISVIMLIMVVTLIVLVVVVKVMNIAGSKSNGGVKRVTVSYADRQSAFDAVNSAHDRRKNKDFQNVDFAKECVLEVTSSTTLQSLDR